MSFTNIVEWQFYTRGGAELEFYIRVGWHLMGKCRTSGMSHVLVGGIQISIENTQFSFSTSLLLAVSVLEVS